MTDEALVASKSTTTAELIRADPRGMDGPQSTIAFRLGQQIYALPIAPVVQIVEMVAITSIPQVNSSVKGVINYHGVTVPVIDLRCHLGLPIVPPGLDTHIIVVTVAGRTLGLIVDQVYQVLELANAQVSQAADILPEGLGDVPLLQGLIHTSEGTVLLLDVEHLFSSEYVQAFTQAIDALAAPDIDTEDDQVPAPDEELA
jgi:purine-binding chemotaxis protein CheW